MTVAVPTTVLIAPLLISMPVQAAPCHLQDRLHGSCNLVVDKPSAGGGGGGSGSGSGGGASGPLIPPPPEGLTSEQAVDAVQSPGAPVVPASAPVTTADLVAAAQASTVFPVPTVHTAPKDKTFAQLRTSLWVEGFGGVQTRPISGDGQTVQLVATPKAVRWDLGEKKIVCKDAGSKDGKTCNYTYQRSSASQPGGSYKITATVVWDVRWTCEGPNCESDGGSLGDNPVPSQPTPLVVSEIQTNNGQ